MNNNNMLSANKVKLHGMVSLRWTTKDKITQYKGLINLYTRDKKILDMDKNVDLKKQYKELKTIQKEIETNRQILDNAIRGDKQKLRNSLAEHKQLQLAYQNSQPKKVLDMIHQVAFTKRKELDRISYKMQMKSQQLIDLKLKYAEIEDRIKFEDLSGQNMIPEEMEAHIITGKVQDAILKKEAALAIRHTYNRMIAIMKKDALYFDAVLITIKNDGINQGKCMINATKLGQIATEYLDDRKHEFQILEKAVRKDMMIRKKDLNKAHEQTEQFLANTKHLLRRDSDINLGRIEIEPTPSTLTLHEDLEVIESTLSQLKYAIFVPTFETIYPCLQDQVQQNARLQEFVRRCEENRNVLLNKQNHANIMKTMLATTMIETTLLYKSEKRNLLTELENQSQKKNETENLIKRRHKMLAKIRISLKHLQLLSHLLTSTPQDSIRTDQLRHQKIHIGDPPPEKPDEEEVDGTQIIAELSTNFAKLIATAREMSEERRDVAFKYFEDMVHQRTRTIPLQKPVIEESLIEGIFLDAHIFNRDDIKKRSAEIVTANSKNDDFAPVFTKRKKSRKLNNF